VKAFLSIVLLLPLGVGAQEKLELVGQLGARTALLVLHTTPGADGGRVLTGEYILFPTRAVRYVEGSRGPQLGATTLKEGASAILYGRDPTGELRGTWRDGVFKGTRYGPGGQERERFEFSEQFPAMDQYSAEVRCQAGESQALAYIANSGRLQGFEWRSAGCTLANLRQEPFKGGLRLASGECAVTLREVGAEVKVEAEQCAQHCIASIPALLVDRRGACRPLRPEVR
jgi:hypothetical protein